MPLLTGPALVAAALLVVAGAAKVADPANTVGALRALHLRSSPALVRCGAAAEAVIGAAAILVGGAFLWALVAASYAAFAGFVVAALRAGTMIGSCGCFGHEDTPPHPLHVALDLALAGVAAAAAAQGLVPAEAIADDPGQGVVVVALAGLALLPRVRGVRRPAAGLRPLPPPLTHTRRSRVRRPVRPRRGHHGAMAATHEVTNQPPPLEGYDVFGADAALVDGVEREGAGVGGRRPARPRTARRLARGDRVGVRPPTGTRPCCAPTTGTATASTRSSTTPRTTS